MIADSECIGEIVHSARKCSDAICESGGQIDVVHEKEPLMIPILAKCNVIVILKRVNQAKRTEWLGNCAVVHIV